MAFVTTVAVFAWRNGVVRSLSPASVRARHGTVFTARGRRSLCAAGTARSKGAFCRVGGLNGLVSAIHWMACQLPLIIWSRKNGHLRREPGWDIGGTAAG